MEGKDNRLLSTRQAALVLGVSSKTLTRWCQHRQISFYLTIGGHKRFALNELHSFLKKNHMQEEP